MESELETSNRISSKRKRSSLDYGDEQSNDKPSEKIGYPLAVCIPSLEHPEKSERLKAVALIASHAKYASSYILTEIAEHLLRQLFEEKDRELVKHLIKVSADIVLLNDMLAQSISDALHRYLDVHFMFDEAVTVQIVNSLIRIEKSKGIANKLDGQMVLSLPCTHKVGLRTRFLNLLRVSCRHKSDESAEFGQLVFNVFHALLKDPYPSVRQAALDGLVSLHRKGFYLTRSCYKRAVSLLRDVDELVRLSAIKLVQEWIYMLQQESSASQIDEGFLQLCAISRDMSMQVRAEVFHALGCMGPVSESVLLQTLSKKLYGKGSKKLSISSMSRETEDNDLETDVTGLDFLVLDASGTFLHGVEDEFFQVRMAAVDALSKLSCFSCQFANHALDLLMDMLNDNFSSVRIHTLYAMLHMAGGGYLNVQEKHMHMLLGMLEDIDPDVRSTARRLLGRVVLPNIFVFQMTTEAILKNMDTCPKDEQDIISLMYDVGTQNNTLVGATLDKWIQQLKTLLSEDFGLDKPRVAALMVLLLAAQKEDADMHFHIPQELMSGVKFLQAKFMGSMNSDSHRRVQNLLCGKRQKIIENPTPSLLCSGSQHQVFTTIRCTSDKIGTTSTESEVLNIVQNIVKAACSTWPFLKNSKASVLKTLRECENDMENIKINSEVCRSLLQFYALYLHSVYLLTKLWVNLTSGNSHHVHCALCLGIDSSCHMLECLGNSLRRMKNCFLGLSKEQNLFIVVLNILSCLFRLSLTAFEVPSHIVSELKSLISSAELLIEGHEIKVSTLLDRVKEVIAFEQPSSLCFLKLVRELPEWFTFEHIPVNDLKEIKAILAVANNSYEKPLIYVAGLPVGITMDITLYNVTTNSRLWTCMILGDVELYSFLDVREFKDCNGVKNSTVTVPFYTTNKVVLCLLEVSIMKECVSDFSSEDIVATNTHIGPCGKLVRLSNIESVYLMERSFKS